MGEEEFRGAIRKGAEKFKEIDKNENIRVISHLDADGISAASIVVRALNYMGMRYSLSILRQLDKKGVELIAREQDNVFLFTDLGSGNLGNIKEFLRDKRVFILDHHKPEKDSSGKNIVHVNPHLFGIDGSKEISGSGVSYLFCRELDKRIKNMAGIALLGAIGDMQEENGFLSLNNEILDDAVRENRIRVERAEDRNNYILLDEKEEQVNELRKFSTMLNACGRLGRAAVGVGACLGDRDMKKKAAACLADYNAKIVKAMDWFNANKKTKNVKEKDGYLIINAQDKVLGTIIGTIASMIARSGSLREGMFVLSMAHLVDGNTKISLRVAGKKDDADLREIIKEMILKLGCGEFGGHKNGAGALIETAKEDTFIEIAMQVLEKRSLEERII